MSEIIRSKRGKENGYSSGVLWKKRGLKRTQASQRQALYDKLTPTEKFAKIRSRRGESLREFNRITLQLIKPVGPKVHTKSR